MHVVNSARGKKYFGECNPINDKTCLSPAFEEAAVDTATNKKIWMPPRKACLLVSQQSLPFDLHGNCQVLNMRQGMLQFWKWCSCSFYELLSDLLFPLVVES